MRFSIVSTVISLVISVNAASLNRRDTSTCVNDLGTVDTGINTLTNYVNGINASTNSLTSVLSVYSYAKKLQISVDASKTSCCSLTAPLSSGDATTVLNKESTIASDFASMSSDVVSKKSVYDSSAQYEYLLKWVFGNLTQSTTPVLDCLASVVPSDSQSTAKGYATTINGALQTLNSEFANVAIPDTEVYPDTQKCINDLTPIASALDITNKAVYAFTSTSSASDFNIIQSQLEQEQSLSQTAATSCCAINHNLDDTESQALSDAIDDIRFNYQNIGNMFAIIKVYLDKINNADYQLKNDFISLSDTTNQIVGCLSKLNPGTIITGDLQSIPTSLQGINDLFANATAS